MLPIAIYIHIPFCVQRCRYCDFNTFAGKQELIPAYLAALENEINQYHEVASEGSVQSIYFGGGTPSLIPAEGIKRIMKIIRQKYCVERNAEVTLEANPGTVNLEYLKRLREAGINRLSLGIQSLIDEELQLLGRIHTACEGSAIFNLARKAGFENISIDLIYGLPAQTTENFLHSLAEVIDLQPEHVSMYPLTLSDHVPLAKSILRGQITQLDDDQAATIYEKTSIVLNKAVYQQYEISNWAKRSSVNDLRSKHNLQYWHNLPYIGMGAGAHGFYHNYRLENVHRIRSYMDKISSRSRYAFPKMPAVSHFTKISLWDEIQETMMLGLRLTEEGVRSAAFYRRYGLPFEELFASQIHKLEQEKLIEWIDNYNPGIRLTEKGRLLGNLVFREFVGIDEPQNFKNQLNKQ